MQNLSSQMQNSENLPVELQNLLDAHHEWLLINAAGKSFALQKSEIEITFERGKILFGYLDDKGFLREKRRDFVKSDAKF
jgi:hypothetical protein